MMERIIHLSLLLLLPPLLFGIINKTKARFSGRAGAPILQPYHDLARLFRKGTVVSSTTTWVFFAGPVVTLGATLLAGLLLPFGHSRAMLSFSGDFILFAYLFGLARFFTTTAAMDTGSAFEGMGAAREVTFAVFTEPGLFCAFLVLVKTSGTLSLGGMLPLDGRFNVTEGEFAPLLMVVIGLAIILLAENSRIPVDDPNTHLELTMIHEVMILDHSGPLLGLLEYASGMKLFLLGTLLSDILLPSGTGQAWMDAGLYLLMLVLFAVAIGSMESLMPRLRMSRVPLLLISSFLLCGSALILFVR